MSEFKKVSVFVGGAQKSGTRSIAEYIRHHPNLSVHITKEGHFFDRQENFINNSPIYTSLTDYYNKFFISSKTKILCDITPDYIFRKNAVERIYNYNSKAKWIILLRNPIERAFSSWNMEVNRNTENLSFEDAIESELNNHDRNKFVDRFLYIGRSRYYEQILNLWKFFPQYQCKIYPAEYLFKQPQKHLDCILDFINMPTNNGYNYRQVHKGKYVSKISEHAKTILEKELYFELNELPNILGWKQNPWTY